MADVDAFLQLMKQQNGSHLYLSVGRWPTIRINGIIQKVKFKEIDNDRLLRFLFEIMSKRQIEVLKNDKEISFIYELPGLGGFRCEIFSHQAGMTAIIKPIIDDSRKMEEINLPCQQNITNLHENVSIPTPWAPYSVMFSRDGGRIAIGGGTYYGGGGILLVSLHDNEIINFKFSELEGYPNKYNTSPTVSGVSFSSDDRHLVTSTWTLRHHYSPTFLFEISGLRLNHRKTFIHEYSDDIGDPCPTGVLFYDGHIVVRNNTLFMNDVFAVWDLPESFGVETQNNPHHLTSSRMVIINGTSVTGGGGSKALGGWRKDIGDYEAGKASEGLICCNLDSDAKKVESIPVPSCNRVTAIARLPSGDRFVTGGLNGEVDLWSWDGHWLRRRLRNAKDKPVPQFPGLTWATYEPASIVGICYLHEGDFWVTVDAGGEINLWRQEKIYYSFQLPVNSSPRSIAAHPKKPWIAVAVKDGMKRNSGVALLKVPM
jgi:hypothetical protein